MAQSKQNRNQGRRQQPQKQLQQRPARGRRQHGRSAASDEPVDGPGQAMESGEPSVAGRTRGMVINGDGTPAGGPPSKPAQDEDEDYESGRHDAAQT